MADVSKVQGPSGPPENLGKKEKASANADKFKEEMRRKVTEVGKIDPDEQKKRKQREEEEEEPAAPLAGPATPPELVTPFSLEKEAKKASPLEMQKGGPGISPTESARPTKTPPKATFYQAPASDEMADDSGLLEEESFGAGASAPSEGAGQEAPSMGAQQTPEAPPPPSPGYQAQPAYQPPQQPPEGGWTPEGQQPVTPGPPETDQQQQSSETTGAVPGMTPKIAGPPKTGKTPQGLTAAELEGAEPSKVRDTSGFFEQLGKEEAATQGAGAPVQPSAFEQILEEEGEKKIEDEKKTSSMEAGGAPSGEAQAMAPSPPGPEALPPYANLHPQVQEVFDRMVGVMTVMTLSGMTETTITLNSPQFASSVFFGTQIIIQEFSTAPHAFNIQLNGTPQAVALFQGNADDLMAAFQFGNYNFRINRLETGYLAERPLFKRKEKASGGNQDQTGDNPQ